jgi:long-subunit acyl-CoA synthetase (AMP-forming)
MVETNTVLICNPDIPEQYTSAIGTPSRNDIEFKIGLRKRLLVKHDSLLLGYIKNGKLRKATDRNGYFHTNDKVCIKDGIYFFLGRIKKRKSIRNKS